MFKEAFKEIKALDQGRCGSSIQILLLVYFNLVTSTLHALFYVT